MIRRFNQIYILYQQVWVLIFPDQDHNWDGIYDGDIVSHTYIYMLAAQKQTTLDSIRDGEGGQKETHIFCTVCMERNIFLILNADNF